MSVIIHKKVARLNYEELIKQGISDAKGSEYALSFLTEQDLIDLGKKVAERETTRLLIGQDKLPAETSHLRLLTTAELDACPKGTHIGPK